MTLCESLYCTYMYCTDALNPSIGSQHGSRGGGDGRKKRGGARSDGIQLRGRYAAVSQQVGTNKAMGVAAIGVNEY